ncbi:MAG: hypothetical protein IPP90_10525 [Gemmatimonadaceae bacterium]|nr:hypothetical protein [Gemmatimonadaceae bacterium]
MRGRDGRDDVVPIVFVHARGDTVAFLLLAQRGRSAVLGTTRNSWRAGLLSPTVALPDVFAPAARAPDAVVTLTATVTHNALDLTHANATGPSGRHDRFCRRSSGGRWCSRWSVADSHGANDDRVVDSGVDDSVGLLAVQNDEGATSLSSDCP